MGGDCNGGSLDHPFPLNAIQWATGTLWVPKRAFRHLKMYTNICFNNDGRVPVSPLPSTSFLARRGMPTARPHSSLLGPRGTQAPSGTV